MSVKVEAFKDGKGNVVISEDSFEYLLACLDNQKFIGEAPQNGDSLSVGKEEYWKGQQEMQDAVDNFNRGCREVLHQNYVFSLSHDGYYLSKKYEHQDKNTPWTGDDVGLVYGLFKDTKRVYKKPENLKPLTGNEEFKEGDTPLGATEDGWMAVESKGEPWLIERPLTYDGEFLTISEDGSNNRPWKKEEIEKIKMLFYNL